MKRMFAILIVFATVLPALNAQRSMFNMGDQVISLGLGIGNTLYIGGTGYSTIVPPLSLSFEQAVAEDDFDKGVLGVIGSLGYTSYKFRYNVDPYDFGWNYHNIILAAGSLFHYPLVERLDTYIGAMLAYNLATISDFGNTGDNQAESVKNFLIAAYIGGRYYFSDQVAAFAQLGYGVAYLTFGVSFRL
jgi:hypothetical protein